MKINLLDLFSGIGGFTLGFQRAGYKIEKHYYSEINKYAIANYKYNFKNAKYVGSVTDFRGKRGQADIITFGSPCQDFSLAGKRAGLEGSQSSLISEAIRIISNIRPSVFIWENVKGAFSTNDGADFWAILNAFTNIGGYRLEWQLLNTKWFLPQNRERIYLIGHLATSKKGFRSVFPIQQNDQLLNKKNVPREGQQQTQNSTSITGDSYRATNTFIQCNDVAGTLTGGGKSGGLHSDGTIKIGGIRGRNPNNPSQRIPGQYQEQVLEVNKKGTSNALTSAQKDNIVLTKNYVQWDVSGKDYNSQQDRAFYYDGNMGTIPSQRTENKINILTKEYSLRRLTEIECERLQGFPDDWTKFGKYKGSIKAISQTQRYKMLGNAITVDVVEEIARRLKRD